MSWQLLPAPQAAVGDIRGQGVDDMPVYRPFPVSERRGPIHTLPCEHDEPDRFTTVQQWHAKRSPLLAPGNRFGRVVWICCHVVNVHNATLKHGSVADGTAVWGDRPHGSGHPVHRALSGFDRLSPRHTTLTQSHGLSRAGRCTVLPLIVHTHLQLIETRRWLGCELVFVGRLDCQPNAPPQEGGGELTLAVRCHHDKGKLPTFYATIPYRDAAAVVVADLDRSLAKTAKLGNLVATLFHDVQQVVREV